MYIIYIIIIKYLWRLVELSKKFFVPDLTDNNSFYRCALISLAIFFIFLSAYASIQYWVHSKRLDIKFVDFVKRYLILGGFLHSLLFVFGMPNIFIKLDIILTIIFFIMILIKSHYNFETFWIFLYLMLMGPGMIIVFSCCLLMIFSSECFLMSLIYLFILLIYIIIKVFD